MKISVITPTADRQIAFALAEKMMARQTMIPDEWIVADGGQTPVECAMGQIHVHDPREPGAANFAHNLLNGLARATGDIIVWYEDDDYYRPQYIESMVAALDRPHAMIAGRHEQPYYHVGARCWRMMSNNATHSSLCQTAMRRDAVDAFKSVVKRQLVNGKFYVDIEFWKSIQRDQWSIVEEMIVIGTKGLPGQAGLGIGHRPNGPAWIPDPNLAQLRAWIGRDADDYAGFAMKAAA